MGMNRVDDVPGSGPGSSVGPGDDIMGGDGYNNPAFGVGDILGGLLGPGQHPSSSLSYRHNPAQPL